MNENEQLNGGMSDHVSPSFIKTRNSNTKNQSLDAYSKPVTSLMQDESCDDSKPVTFESTRVICNKNAQICCLLASMPSFCISSSTRHSTTVEAQLTTLQASVIDAPHSRGSVELKTFSKLYHQNMELSLPFRSTGQPDA